MGERTPDGLAIVAEGHQTYENCLFLSNSVGNHFLHCITTALQSASALLLQNTDQVSHTHVCICKCTELKCEVNKRDEKG